MSLTSSSPSKTDTLSKSSASLKKGELRWADNEDAVGNSKVLSPLQKDFIVPLDNSLYNSTSLSSEGNSNSTFTEKKFRLPPRDITLDLIPKEDKRRSKEHLQLLAKRRELAAREKLLLTCLDRMKATQPPPTVSSCEVLQSTRIAKESAAELNVINAVICRKPGDFSEGLRRLLPPLPSNDSADNDSDDDSKSMTSSRIEQIERNFRTEVQEKIEDLLQEDVECWLKIHGKELAAKNTNQQRRLLRKWFKGNKITNNLD